jgi:hypothetical protein
MTLPTNPIVHNYLTGWDFTSSSWQISIYSSADSFDTISNTVDLNFTIANNNIWRNASGFVIAFSSSYFNKRGVLKLNYAPGTIDTHTHGIIFPHF